MLKMFHKWHDESKAKWNLIDFKYVKKIEDLENTELYHASFSVECKCGYKIIRTRSYFVWDGNGKKYSFYDTYQESLNKATVYNGDNYHL